MKIRWLGLLLTMVVASHPSPTIALDFTNTVFDDHTNGITLSGTINVGDRNRLMAYLESIRPTPVIKFLVLDSIGGNVIEAEALAKDVDEAKVSVLVSGICASACFLMFAASPAKVAFTDVKIGVHSASLNQNETPLTMATTLAIARDARAYGVPSQIIGKMVSTPPGEMVWLNEVELLAMGTKLIPRVIAAPSQSVPQPSAALQNQGIQSLEQSPAFQAGRAQRFVWEAWFNSLNGDARDGAMFWTGQRSLKRPQSCYALPNRPSSEWISGCITAQSKLALSDLRRMQEADFKAGWNSN